MTTFKGNHPWFDEDPIVRIREICLENGFDYIDAGRNRITLMNDAKVVKNENGIAKMHGPRKATHQEKVQKNVEMLFSEWIGTNNRKSLFGIYNGGINFTIGSRRNSIRLHQQKATFLVASEPVSDSDWHHINSMIFLDGGIHTETEIALAGGFEAMLEMKFKSHPIFQIFRSYEIAEANQTDLRSESLILRTFDLKEA